MTPLLLALVLSTAHAGPDATGKAATSGKWVDPKTLSPADRVKQAEARAAADKAAATVEALGADCTLTRDQALEALAESAEKATYDCLIADDDARKALLDATLAIGAVDPLEPMGDAVRNRYSRALALHRIQRLPAATSLTDALTVQEVHALNPSDRRLLRDAVYAHKGRKSPSAEHAGIFEKFSWYAPSDTFTKARLSELDREIIAFIDAPPPLPEPPPPPSAADAMADAAPAAAEKKGCGCAAVTASGGVWLAALLGLAVRRRR